MNNNRVTTFYLNNNGVNINSIKRLIDLHPDWNIKWWEAEEDTIQIGQTNNNELVVTMHSPATIQHFNEIRSLVFNHSSWKRVVSGLIPFPQVKQKWKDGYGITHTITATQYPNEYYQNFRPLSCSACNRQWYMDGSFNDMRWNELNNLIERIS